MRPDGLRDQEGSPPPERRKRRKNMKETRLFLSEIFHLPFLRDRDLRKWLKDLFRVDYSFCEVHSGNVVKKLDYCLISYLIILPPNIDT